MKPNTMVLGLNMLAALVGWTSLCGARPHHSHHHGRHKPGTTQTSVASSGSGFITESRTATSSSIGELSFANSVGASGAVDHHSSNSAVRVQVSSMSSGVDAPNEVKASGVDISSDSIMPGTKTFNAPSDRIKETGLVNNLEGTSYFNGGEASHSPPSIPTPGLAPLELRQVDADGHHPWTYGTANLGPFPQPTSTYPAPDSTATGVCPSGNGTTFKSDQSKIYQVLCDIDFLNDDYPFKLVNSFDSCVQACDSFNAKAGSNECVAALFVPSRLHGLDDCYLKSAVDNPSVATVGIEGAILLEAVTYSTSQPTATIPPSANVAPSIPSSTLVESGTKITYASGTSVIVPQVAVVQLHGPSRNVPSEQYINVKAPDVLKLSDSLLVVGVNDDLTTKYDVSLDSGYLQVNSSTQLLLTPMTDTPHLSRDGGQGGVLNGQHVFLFCDTGSYSTTTSTANGNFLGFVSSSLAVDTGMNGLYGKPLNLQDGIGAWSDNVGRMRGLAPLTQGELAYNAVMQGKGQRYAIWPESSLIPLDAETSLIFAPIVYDNVDLATRAAVFTYVGATLLSVTSAGEGGPIAARKVEKLFNQDEIEWGCAGGIRSWGPSGIGGSDGKIYVFGNVQDGILLARTSPGNVADRNSYEYWNGQSWSSQMLDSSSTAFFITGSPYMNIDIFYSPRHLTFIAVYLNHYADSTFYYRHLVADSAIIPPYAPGGNQDEDIVENVLKYKWSDEAVLYKAAQGMNGHYIYAGGVHREYYGSDDIANGGSKMLISWTAPTGQDPSTLASEYQIITAEIDWT